ncbi:uncharacterized protein LOC114516601 [Dendronephthya gigantea]|uniref:uncharacterized protein LOC114516601 n=1 Tax=Dendronephthya gigantea TaxID=151771 RepID=UPI00106CEE5A|nr:uncharacterized protein LOC114516601 [Dendronephthya gigantea]
MAEYKRKETNLNPVVRIMLRGLYDEGSPWHVLLGMHYILKAIWQDVLIYYKSKIAIPCDNSEFSFVNFLGHSSAFRRDGKPFADLRFPESQDININMMPFVMAKRFKDTRLPDYLKQYFEQIVGPCIVESERGKIGYLTIHECFVEKGTSQRRPGIHTESPRVLMLKGGKGESKEEFEECPLSWGGGIGSIQLQGGIYMASNVENSCKVWNCEILKPEGRNSPDVVGEHGDIEHLRSLLPEECETMDANTVYWMTDRTPHESLPLSEGTYRQYFRLITSQVSGWFEDHSTKNPLGVVPDPKITKIIRGSKFDPDSCFIVDTAAE